ncbi:hypothetical protein HEK616_70960 [Streptomyces nigrescens]|uniref:Secreted protein n=1 Tax=Streptomyces nigrescens TaxID=1920 RepID=A0ABM8A4K5_STRNI|nr:DUF6344 domain-containing protein [Streptomyces nigrescens]BDM73609.1 hypothetical protein HEK616_70960 [Streptomyces nigrescens]
MAANKVMTFWAMCLAVLGKLLASLGVSAPASAARREAALYERTLGNADAGTEPRGADGPDADTPTPGTPVAAAPAAPTPGAKTPALETPVVEGPTVPAPRTVTRYGQAAPARPMLARPELPPTIKQRIHAEAHGASPGLRSRCIRGTEPLPTASAGAAPQTAGSVNPRPAAIPAARRRAHPARTV